MNIPVPSAKVTPLVACIAIVAIAGAYFLFLYASWVQFQRDSATRDSKINTLLDRIPSKAAPDVESAD